MATRRMSQNFKHRQGFEEGRGPPGRGKASGGKEDTSTAAREQSGVQRRQRPLPTGLTDLNLNALRFLTRDERAHLSRTPNFLKVHSWF